MRGLPAYVCVNATISNATSVAEPCLAVLTLPCTVHTLEQPHIVDSLYYHPLK